MISVKVKVDLKGVERKLSKRNIERGRYVLASKIHGDMNQFVPYLTGDLRNMSTTSNDGSNIEYTAPYAGAQFEGFINGARIRNYTTPGTGRRWDLRAKMRFADTWADTFVRGAGLK